MKRRTFANLSAAAALLAGCAIFSGGKGGPARVDDLLASIERVYVDAELSKQKTRAAVAHLQALVASDYKGDAVSAYAGYIEAVENSEERAETLRASVEPMMDEAEDLFEKWERDLDEISSTAMRERSQARLNATRKRYEAIVAATDPALAAFDAFNQSLRDHALFLGHDLNPASLSVIRDDVRALAEQQGELNQRLDACMVVTRSYVESAALPASADGEPRPVAVSGEDEAVVTRE